MCRHQSAHAKKGVRTRPYTFRLAFASSAVCVCACVCVCAVQCSVCVFVCVGACACVCVREGRITRGSARRRRCIRCQQVWHGKNASGKQTNAWKRETQEDASDASKDGMAKTHHRSDHHRRQNDHVRRTHLPLSTTTGLASKNFGTFGRSVNFEPLAELELVAHAHSYTIAPELGNCANRPR